MRLQKYLAHAGVASRRAAEEIVRAGRVTIDGRTVTDPARDVPDDGTADVLVDGRPVTPVAETVVFAVNKPAGVVSTASDTHGRPTVVGLVPAGKRRLYPVGRLDAETTGLILLTDDGALADLLTHPRYEVPKTYVASVRGGRVGDVALRALREGVELDDGPTLPAEVEQPEPGELRITLREGRKRQVRRMCRAVGHPVVTLRRVRLGPLELGRLREGQWRALDPREVAALRDAARRP
ncbi:Ribosomal large subunit pseudouridine synthase B [Patulibacter medicamentivorans]|uniref:Pseudouridine synthase n=1 Tax=Patulibacter medicamentivorans TaxID=1097667 RepID=H0E2E9_9ACTN|nr:pseudouridine synthase [Patulibacter medicamentivorans]EHN12169.1 Ribosomal large subunit pseudouridine synthase B [Patulibacter medicamentivorans]